MFCGILIKNSSYLSWFCNCIYFYTNDPSFYTNGSLLKTFDPKMKFNSLNLKNILFIFVI